MPVIIPEDMYKPLEFLADGEVRKIAGVKTSNEYLFPNLGMYSSMKQLPCYVPSPYIHVCRYDMLD